MGGSLRALGAKESPDLAFSWRYSRMLQWKPKLIALLLVLALVAAISGQFTWGFDVDQFTWL